MENDSIDGIFNTLHDYASISKWAGGIGLHIHNIRAKGTSIIGTNGTSNGLVPMLRVFNNTARYVDQGGGKRREVSQFIWNHGMQTLKIFWNSVKIMATKRCVQGIYFMLYGFRICL